MKGYLLVVILLGALTVKAQTPDTTGHRNKKDSVNLKNDSLKSKPFRQTVRPPKKEPVYHPDSNHSPRKAVMRSLMIPGWGQIYNRHGLYWRLPALYGGLGILIYEIYTNGNDYNGFLNESQWRSHGRPDPITDPVTGQPRPVNTKKDDQGNIVQNGDPMPYYNGQFIGNVNDQAIYNYKDNLRRNRDLSAFIFIAVWGINAVDAYVEAKFINSYTMDNNLSFKISPSVIHQPVYASNFNSTFTPALKITFFLK